MIKDLLLVGLGGGVGSMLRLLTSRVSARFISSDWALVGTFIANIVGCFLIGLLAGWLLPNMGKNESLSLLLITGFCGGYTTFSAFASENLQLWQSGNTFLFILYIFFSITLGVLAVWGGFKLN
ncbi:MAG: fluoride efflux transporter CrcB [Dysgonamonadaceae bacterium]|nr:fluoride efflux transporter CrcB [Dysgonamonadaceae bacterium]MDD3356365.1 fluoride efflux transporter CrcB [Dysgonamonadaceae bacterium]MDD3727391.1 fluoride efflux transporter CrcB [Dysgonamonadaceae bacterium]MDD4246275.1 fluoride efflux transporter CrcB [Dysgonamonadaceae bacterium]